MTLRPGTPHKPRSRRLGAALGAAGLALLVPAIALAHPLGNFTINHFAAIRVAPQAISLDVIIDRAEIPAFQELQRLDFDGDGTLAPADVERERVAACLALAPHLRLAVEGRTVDPRLVAAGLSLPPGSGGLLTMRLVCQFEVPLVVPIEATTTIAFEDRSFSERIGWREIVVLGDGVTVTGADPGPAPDPSGVSGRLTSYPMDLLAQPLDMRSIKVEVSPGGAALPPWTALDAVPLDPIPPDSGAAAPIAQPSVGAVPGPVMPGGVAQDLAALVDVRDLTPLAILGSLAIAFALGVVHALSPGHGKTIMAAYLVGTKGSSRQAVGLGLAVTVSHTLGVLALAGITLAASSVLPPERFYPILAVVSGALVIAIGASLLWSRLRAMVIGGKARGHGHSHGHGHAHDHEHADSHPHPHAHPHPHPHPHAPADTSVSWRGMIALGLSGGLVPSASALILLLGSIAAGRVAYGLVLVLGFGAGMAFVLAGIGLLIVNARRLVERRPAMAGLRRIVPPIQLGTAALVVVLGVVLIGQAVSQVL